MCRVFPVYLKDQRGNFSIMMSIMMLVLLACVGAAIDISNMVSNRQKAADIADSTALAAALVARDGTEVRLKTAKGHFDSNRAIESETVINGDPVITFDDTHKEVTVEVTAQSDFFLMHIFGFDNNTVTAKATVGYAIDFVPPISIAFAFDTSGSMGATTPDGVVKIEALEEATGDLFTAMFEASENPTLLQSALSTTFSTYNTDLVINDLPRNGYQHILDTMSMDPSFVAVGGTNSTPSVQFAIDQLTAQKGLVNDSKWSGHLVFMTDGVNNDMLSDTETEALCDTAKDLGYTIYTVAFDAPKQGKDLLEACASDKTLAFESTNAKKLKENFEIIGQQLGEATIRLKS